MIDRSCEPIDISCSVWYAAGSAGPQEPRATTIPLRDGLPIAEGKRKRLVKTAYSATNSLALVQ